MRTPSSLISPFPFRMIQRRFDTWNAFLRRRPIAKIRVNWIVIALLGFCVMGSLYNAYDIFGQDQEPRPTPLSVLFSPSPGENRHVEVTGRS